MNVNRVFPLLSICYCWFGVFLIKLASGLEKKKKKKAKQQQNHVKKTSDRRLHTVTTTSSCLPLPLAKGWIPLARSAASVSPHANMYTHAAHTCHPLFYCSSCLFSASGHSPWHTYLILRFLIHRYRYWCLPVWWSFNLTSQINLSYSDPVGTDFCVQTERIWLLIPITFHRKITTSDVRAFSC